MKRLASMLLLFVQIQEEWVALPLRICHHHQVRHRLIVDLHERVTDVERDVLHKLGLLLIHLNLVHVYAEVGSDEKVEVVSKDEAESQDGPGLLESELDFLGCSFFQEKEDQRVLSYLKGEAGLLWVHSRGQYLFVDGCKVQSERYPPLM